VTTYVPKATGRIPEPPTVFGLANPKAYPIEFSPQVSLATLKLRLWTRLPE
jgi:hypothetical protein